LPIISTLAGHYFRQTLPLSLQLQVMPPMAAESCRRLTLRLELLRCNEAFFEGFRQQTLISVFAAIDSRLRLLATGDRHFAAGLAITFEISPDAMSQLSPSNIALSEADFHY